MKDPSTNVQITQWQNTLLIAEMLHHDIPARHLRFVQQLLKKKRTNLKYSGDRAFSIDAPKLQNRLSRYSTVQKM